MYWQELSTADRALGLLNVAFWGGTTAVSAKAGGGTLADDHSLTRLRNNTEGAFREQQDLTGGQLISSIGVKPESLPSAFSALRKASCDGLDSLAR